MAVHAALELVPDALLHARDELPGHRAADHPVDELEATAFRQRFDLDLGDCVLTVPAGLLDVPAQAVRGRPAPFPGRPPGPAATTTSMPARTRSRSSSTSSCCSPMVHINNCSVAGLTSTRTVGSSACNRARPCTSLSSSLDDRAEMATGSSGSGIDQGESTAGSAGSERVSPVSACAKPGHRDDVAGHWPAAMPLRVAPDGPGDRTRPFVQIVFGVPGLVLRMTGEPGEMPADVHRDIGQQGPGEHPDHARPGRRRDRWWS